MKALACASLAVLALAAGCTKTAKAPDPAGTVGRFVIVHSPQVERDTVLLDTATGRTWVETEITDLTGEPEVWEPMPQLNTDADWSAVRAAHPPKASGNVSP